jgi:membrane-bound lytic murein transglycosylase A
MRWQLSVLAVFLILGGCARAPLKNPQDSLRIATEIPKLEDSYSIESLNEAFTQAIEALKTSRLIPNEFTVVDRKVNRDHYRLSLIALKEKLHSWTEFNNFVRQNFDFLEVYGDKTWGDVFSTGYYSPLIQARKKKHPPFTQPVYKTPPDLINIDLNAFSQKQAALQAMRTHYEENHLNIPTLVGRLDPSSKKIVPYFDRAQIDANPGILSRRSLEIAWVQPIDSFFLQIQGSGILEFPDKQRIWLGYAAKNGADYIAIGKFLWDFIPKEKMSMQRIRAHLESLSQEDQQAILNKNPSYVFFTPNKNPGAPTFSGALAIGNRTIASETKFFPKGVLGFLEINEPKMQADTNEIIENEFVHLPRWVFDLDTGGAIKGGGRIDLYFGENRAAEIKAGAMKERGKLWYVFPKSEFLEKLIRDRDQKNAPQNR